MFAHHHPRPHSRGGLRWLTLAAIPLGVAFFLRRSSGQTQRFGAHWGRARLD